MRTIKKRRIKGKTDYKARLNLLKSGMPRVVVRKTNRYIVAQYVKSDEAQDTVAIQASSRELLEYGWEESKKGSLKSLPACYLTGLLLGKEIKEKEKKPQAILDIGLARNIKKSRIYAVLNGLVDSGLQINHNKSVFPESSRIKGEHLKNKIDFEKIKSKIAK